MPEVTEQLEDRARRLRETFADLRELCKTKSKVNAMAMGWLIDYLEKEAPEVGGDDAYDKALIGLECAIAFSR